MPRAKRQAGLSLIELIVTIAILSIVIGFTSQAWSWWVNKTRHRVIVENYYSLFAFARWAAVSNNSLVTVCPLSHQKLCIDDWQKPVSVFLDANNDKAPDNDEILRQLESKLGSFTIKSRTSGRGYFQFTDQGVTHGAMGSLVLCPDNPSLGTMSYMPVNIAGRFRAEHDKDADGIIKLPWGGKVTC